MSVTALGPPSFADELFATLTVYAQPQISELVRRGICRPRASDQPPQTVAGLQVPTGGAVAVLILAGERREELGTLQRLLDSDVVSKRREVLKTQVNRVVSGDARSFQTRWFDDLAYVCDLPGEVVGKLRKAQNLPDRFRPERVEQAILRMRSEAPPVRADTEPASELPVSSAASGAIVEDPPAADFHQLAGSAPELPLSSGNSATRRTPHRRLAFGGAAMVIGLIVAGVVALIDRQRSDDHGLPGCQDIGKFVEGIDDFRWNRQTWVDAYNAAGGRAVLGCPVPRREQGLVHRWDQGWSQDLADEKSRQSRLMALQPDRVIVMSGDYWYDYTYPHGIHAARLQGYPTSDPIDCDNARIVPLDRGEYTPGAMVTTPQNRFVWLPHPVWRKYQELGGLRAFGRPLNALDKSMTGTLQFEHGHILLVNGQAHPQLDDPTRQGAPATDLCPT
ncbi:hypothetical protein [Nocardia iowensis]|uniref:Uncharacterized protein n=1 Tax=Nocardia iowensis TaxID=204891 RepID=A0ABX8RWG1_NOCIO|nr:hypothetical protein [Nocardia iowensis]QXN91861.1 hypothetical protein KV110_01310 [Nocardia iowensis]